MSTKEKLLKYYDDYYSHYHGHTDVQPEPPTVDEILEYASIINYRAYRELDRFNQGKMTLHGFATSIIRLT